MQPTVLVYTTRPLRPAAPRPTDSACPRHSSGTAQPGPWPTAGNRLRRETPARIPLTARSKDPESRKSPVTTSTSNSRTLLAGRTKARTVCPRASNFLATCQPMKPVAPVTRVGFTQFKFLSKRPSHQLERVAELRIDSQRRRGLKTAMHHAMVAARIVAGSVVFPLAFWSSVPRKSGNDRP